MSRFLGDGINSLILTLSNSVILVLMSNLFLDLLFRIAVLIFSLKCFLYGMNLSHNETDKSVTQVYIHLMPIAAMLFCRVAFFITLVRMSFDEKQIVCKSFQQYTGDLSPTDMEQDRLFMRQFKKGRIIRTIWRSMIPPELYFW